LSLTDKIHLPPGFLPIVVGCASTTLSRQEEDLFSSTKPCGLILFTRNCADKAQVTNLVESFKQCTGNSNALILIDQEGGRVARLKPPVWPEFPPAKLFASLALENLVAAKQAVYENYVRICDILTPLGINVNCAPLLDIPTKDAHGIIGDRSCGEDPEIVAELALEICRAHLDSGVYPVIKHIPGHGRAKADSHEEKPIVDASFGELSKCDFAPFRRLRDMPIAMTAHIVYTAIDSENVATLSPKVIKLIRDDIGFKNTLISDDLDMKALRGLGTLSELAHKSLAAGCDIALHCTGKYEDNLELLKNFG
jgi:beta-N-acetylhexosaminidase